MKHVQKLTIKIPEWRHWGCSGVFIINFENILPFFLVFLMLTFSMYLFAGINRVTRIFRLNPSSANPTKRSNTLKQFADKLQQMVWVCLTILWDWRLKVWINWITCNSIDLFSVPAKLQREHLTHQRKWDALNPSHHHYNFLPLKVFDDALEIYFHPLIYDNITLKNLQAKTTPKN